MLRRNTGWGVNPAMRRRRVDRAQQIGPLRTIIRDVVGSDGLVYQQLECTHRVLLLATDYTLGTEARRRCWLCGLMGLDRVASTANQACV
jgi:hypothetical protein